MTTRTWMIALITTLSWCLGGCPDQFSTSGGGIGDDDDTADDDTGDDDTDDTVTADDVQSALDNVSGWAADGCSQVIIYAVSSHSTVDLTFEANLDLASIEIPPAHDEHYDIPGPGAVLSVRAGGDLGTDRCTASPGTPTITDNYSVQSGTVTLTLDRGPQQPIDQTTATIEFAGVTLQRVGGSEVVTMPDATFGGINVGWEP
jgi:hypothetical protein